MQIKKRKTLGILFSLLLIVGAAASFTAPRSHALEAAQDNSKVTSTNRRTACKRRCEDKYSSCLAAKKAKGWDDDRAEKTCGLGARGCKEGCDRR
jgi:hypothetical protein